MSLGLTEWLIDRFDKCIFRIESRRRRSLIFQPFLFHSHTCNVTASHRFIRSPFPPPHYPSSFPPSTPKFTADLIALVPKCENVIEQD